MTIEVTHPGISASIQDMGRYGSQKYGVIVSGAMDPISYRIGNLLVGNDENAAAIEITLLGTSYHFRETKIIAITGADLQATLDGKRAPTWRPILVKEGSRLQFRSGKTGSRAYLAIAGGIQVPELMGSKSTYLKAGIGGFQGRRLQKGDRLDSGPLSEISQALMEQLQGQEEAVSWFADYTKSIHFGQNKEIRVLKGSEYDKFTKESQESFHQASFYLTTEADRMGYQLDGPSLKLTHSFELLSEGVTYGTIQVPANGKPIVLMADRQTTGGYPKIGQVITADLASLAQSLPKHEIRFKLVTIEEAERALLDQEARLEKLAISIRQKAGI